MIISKRIAYWCAVVAIVLAALACSVDPGPVGASAEKNGFAITSSRLTIPPQWDPRLDALGITYQPAPNCAPGCWRLVSAVFEDANESGGNHNIYGRLLTTEGNAPAGLPWHVQWPDGDVRVLTKPAPEWADFPMYAEYDPDEGECGGYTAFAGDDRNESDVVGCMGLPERQHVNFRLVWQWVVGGATATPSVTPTPSVIPCGSCTEWLYLPIVSRG